MTVELLPCSMCRRVPAQQVFGAAVVCPCGAYEGMRFGDSAEMVRRRWNLRHGSLIAPVEISQNEPACAVAPPATLAFGETREAVFNVRTGAFSSAANDLAGGEVARDGYASQLLPCSMCRRVPTQGIDGHVECSCGRVVELCLDDSREYVRKRWNRAHGCPLTLAEMPQDVPACDGAGLLHDRVHVEIGKARAAKAVRVPKRCWLHYQPNCALCAEFEPSEGDGVRVVPSAASCVERGRSCADGSVGACSGGVR